MIEVHIRARDVRAIAFCVATTLVLGAAVYIFTQDYIVTGVATAAYALWLGTRPRMIRIFRRLRGEPDWGGYFRD